MDTTIVVREYLHDSCEWVPPGTVERVTKWLDGLPSVQRAETIGYMAMGSPGWLDPQVGLVVFGSESSMTVDQFIDAMKTVEHPERWGFDTFFPHFIRHGQGDICDCPIEAVGRAMGVPLDERLNVMGVDGVVSLGRHLGLSHDDACRIVAAADGTPGHNTRLRKRLINTALTMRKTACTK